MTHAWYTKASPHNRRRLIHCFNWSIDGQLIQLEGHVPRLLIDSIWWCWAQNFNEISLHSASCRTKKKIVKKSLTVFRLIDYLASELFCSTVWKGLLKSHGIRSYEYSLRLKARRGGGTRIICGSYWKWSWTHQEHTLASLSSFLGYFKHTRQVGLK